MAAEEFDIVVYGATGYTGRLVAEHFGREYSGKSDAPDWAMPGRSTTASWSPARKNGRAPTRRSPSRPKLTEPQPVRSVG